MNFGGAVRYRAELGYAEITSAFTSAANPATSDVTGLTITIDAPGTPIELELFASGLSQTLANANPAILFIQEGAVTVGRVFVGIGTNGRIYGPIRAVRRFTPSAGTHTYKVTATPSAGTDTLYAQSDYPAFLVARRV